MKIIRVFLEILVIIFSSIVGMLLGLRIRGPLMFHIDENIFLQYMCPGAAGGLFLSVLIILYFRKKLSFLLFCGLLLGALVGIGLAVLLGDFILDKFEPPGSDLLFMVLYPIFFCLCGMGAGFLISRKASRYIENRKTCSTN